MIAARCAAAERMAEEVRRRMFAALEQADRDPLDVAGQTGIGAYRMCDLIDGAEATVSEVLVIGMTIGVRPAEWFDSLDEQGAAL